MLGVGTRGFAHRLGDPGHLALDDGARRLGGLIARSDARATGREHQRTAVDVAEMPQALLDQRAIVGDDLPRGDLAADLPRELLEAVAAGVVLAARRARGADGEDRDAQRSRLLIEAPVVAPAGLLGAGGAPLSGLRH